MRLFLDTNVMTYIAVFEGYLVEGTPEERLEAANLWRTVQGNEPDDRMLHEIEALRVLYLVDEAARFDWLFSDLALAEIHRIENSVKRGLHRRLIRRLVEHRSDVYSEADFPPADRESLQARVRTLFPDLPPKMMSDAQQFCEAELVDAYYFVTNDLPFIRVARASDAAIEALRPSDLPFVASQLAERE